LLVTDDDQTELSSEVVITQPEELRTMQESVVNAICNGDENGSIDFVMMGGTAPYQYAWSDGSDASNRSNLAAGDYMLEVTDGNGCVFSKLYSVVEPEALTISSLMTTEDEDGTSNGSISIVVSGGTGDITYEWSNGANTANIDNLPAGEYSVNIMDANGCSFTQSGIVVNTVTDITDLESVTAFNMYPVPALNYLNVNVELSTAQNLNMNILDATGRLVWSTNYNTSQISEKIDLTTFAQGIYTISLITSESIQSESFIVIK